MARHGVDGRSGVETAGALGMDVGTRVAAGEKGSAREGER